MKYSFFTQNTTNPKIQYYLHHIVITVLIGIVYYPTLDAPFIFDDFPNIVINPAVHPANLRDIVDIFQSKYSPTRPLALLTFSLNYLMGGLDVFGYHLVNIVIHIVVTFLIYNIFINFPLKTNLHSNKSENRYTIQNVSFWAASLWALNPIQTQAVTYIVQRMTSLAALFYLAAIYIFIRWRNNTVSIHIAIPLIISFFLFGMACKEIVITLPITLLLIDYLFYSKKVTKYHQFVMGFVFMGLIGAFFFYLNGKLPDFFNPSLGRNFSPWERVMTEWRVVWHYLSLYFLPLPHRMHLAYDVTISKDFLTPWTTIISLLTISTSWFIAWKYRFSFPVLSFAWFFFFLALALESTFLNLEIAFAHRIYLPTIFILFALLASIPQNIFKKITICFLLLLGLWSFWTISRNEEWNQVDNFWQSDLSRGSSPARALNNQAAALIEKANFKDALPLLQQGLTTNPIPRDRKLIMYNMGSTLYYLGNFDESLATFKNILTEFGALEETPLFIGLIFLKQNKIVEAKNWATKLTNSKTLSPYGKILQANILTKEESFEEAASLVQTTIKKSSQNKIELQIKLHLELARIYLLSDNPQKAYEIYLTITDMFPHNYFAWSQIYKMLHAGGETDRAEKVRNFLESKGISDKKNRPQNQ